MAVAASTMRPLGVHDGAIDRGAGARIGAVAGMARPVGVYENTVGAAVRAALVTAVLAAVLVAVLARSEVRYCDMRNPPGR